jgi:hypothetical protein
VLRVQKRGVEALIQRTKLNSRTSADNVMIIGTNWISGVYRGKVVVALWLERNYHDYYHVRKNRNYPLCQETE